MSRRRKNVKRTKVLKLTKPNFKIIESKVPYISLIIVSLLLSTITSLVVFVLQDKLPPEVPLFYGFPKGQEQLTTSIGLLIPNLIAIVFQIVNTTISYFIEGTYLKKTLIISGFAVALFASITSLQIVLLVGNI